MAAPVGNKNATKAKRWTEAIQKALARFNRAAVTGDDPKTEVKAGEALDAIALNVVQAALEGDWWAVTEIGNRLEGKPPQTLDVTGEITHARELSDTQLLERLERALHTAGAVGEETGPQDAAGLHPVHQRPLDS